MESGAREGESPVKPPRVALYIPILKSRALWEWSVKQVVNSI